MANSAFKNFSYFLHTWKQQGQEKRNREDSLSSSQHASCVFFARMSGSHGDSRQFIQEDPHVYTYDSDRIQNAQTTYCTFDAESGAEKKGLTRRFVIYRSNATPDFPHKERFFLRGGGPNRGLRLRSQSGSLNFANKIRKLYDSASGTSKRRPKGSSPNVCFFFEDICAHAQLFSSSNDHGGGRRCWKRKRGGQFSFTFPPWAAQIHFVSGPPAPLLMIKPRPKKSKNLANISQKKKNLIFQHNSFFLVPYAAKLSRVFMGPNWASLPRNMRQ